MPFTPAGPGGNETVEVTGLTGDTVYYFAIRVGDDAGNVSSLSNVASASTEDNVAPADVTDLRASTGETTLGLKPATAISSSGDKDASHSKEKAADRNSSTFWISTPRSTMQTEHITFDLGASVQTVQAARIRLRSRADTGGAFPKDFQLQLSDDNILFTTVHAETAFTAAAGTWYDFDFTPAAARYVRVLVTRSVKWGTSYIVHLAEVEVYEEIPAGVQLRWTAPGDNFDQKTADSYDVRYSSSPIGDNTDFGLATELNGEPARSPPGSSESMTVPGLASGTYYFRMKAFDESSNSSGLSNQATVTVN